MDTKGAHIMWKRSLIIGLVLVIALVVPLTAFAQNAQGTGSVHAEGDGRVYVRGNGWVRISGQGHLVIMDLAGDATIDIHHNTADSESSAATAESNQAHARGSRLVFRRFNGSATIMGSHIVVMMRGRNIVLDAEGRGVVRLRGVGTYTSNGQVGEWSASRETSFEMGGGLPARTR
jgi:hypothetical protein